MKTIIIIQHEPLSPNIEKKFCLKELQDAGFKIEYWDISQICNPGVEVADEIRPTYFKKLQVFDDLKNLWSNLLDKNYIVIAEIYFNYDTIKIWKLICNSGIPLVKIESYANSQFKMTLIEKMMSYVNTLSFLKLAKNILFKIGVKIFKIYEYDYLLTSSSLKNCAQRINHPDYDDFLQNKDAPPFLTFPYICFIDTGFGIHPDQIFYESGFVENNDLWQKKLCRFFSYIEKEYNLPVVIAVHPKINYPEESFGGRKKIKYKTLNLVLNAEFILQDISNSLSFSAIANKKIAIITTNEFWKVYKDYFKKLKKNLDFEIFNIDKIEFSQIKPTEINESMRKSYLERFICCEETKDTPSSSLMIEFLKKL